MAEPICACDGTPAELTIFNSPGLERIAYRVADFGILRHVLLQALPGEQALTSWRPGADGDLAVQMIEWWAYIGDILIFYNERAANESYLRTATLPASVNRLVRAIGYRPRPGVGATGLLAALVGGTRAITLPKGLSFDSKPGPGEQPQTFELYADTIVSPAGAVGAVAPAYLLWPSPTTVLIASATVPFDAGDTLLMRSRTGAFDPLLMIVKSVKTETGPDGKQRTRAVYTSPGPLPLAQPASDVEVLFAASALAVYNDLYAVTLTGNFVHLAGVARDVHPGDYIVLASPDVTAPLLSKVSSAGDTVWYANYDTGSNPWTPPTSNPAVAALAVMHTVLSLDSLDGNWINKAGKITARYGWRSVGPLLDQPTDTYSGSGPLAPPPNRAFPAAQGVPVIVADATGSGMAGLGSVTANGMSLAMSALPVPPLPLQSPLTAYFNVLGISRGKTVPSEVLGSGDATVTGQAFTLAKTPLTYFASGDGVVSTLAVRVNGRLWREAKSFYQQPADAQIFVTDEDENQVTHVQFGDGVNGARLPTGSNNVVATYRYGSGAKSPLSGEITVIDKPWPNLKSVKNPVAVGGGADPDPPDQVRKYAPLSVMTFGRAISGDDYQAIAARAPGVTRVQAVWSFDGTEQRGAMTLYVGDTPAAAASATTAIAAAGDPHRHVVVVQATPVPVAVVLLVLVDPAYDPAIVAAAVRAAFLDPDTGLFGANRLGVGDAIFHSAMSAACINCEGALALRGTAVVAYDIAAQSIVLLPGPRFDPGEGAFFNLDPNWLFVLAGVDPA